MRQLNISGYHSVVFDCDGVVLDSNRVKTEAFYKTTLPYGQEAAQAMVDYHVANGGISRYKKFAYFLQHILPEYGGEQEPPLHEALLETYACYVREGLLTCQVAPGLQQLRLSMPEVRWLIISGGDQAELREVFAARGIDSWFDGGIFGSPDTKDEILQRELNCENILRPGLFLGDSKYDYRAATAAGLDFVFLSGWTEVPDWKVWVEDENILQSRAIADFL